MTNIVGTGVSGFFLYLIAALNVVILVSILRVFMEMRRGLYDDEQLEEQLNKRGLMNRFFGPLARRIDTPWKMYPIGVLFGLGFDTASEVALLVLSGTAVASGLPFYAILALPLLFAAGMSLFDTLDGCFMNFAYGWAFARPIRKVYYNITITALSVAAAFLIGTIELLGLLPSEIHLQRGILDVHGQLQHQYGGFHHRRHVRDRPGSSLWQSGGSAGSSRGGTRRRCEHASAPISDRASLSPSQSCQRSNRPPRSSFAGRRLSLVGSSAAYCFVQCHTSITALHQAPETD